ncbi:hypothetical protein D3C72_2120360 [compost metagenome]
MTERNGPAKGQQIGACQCQHDKRPEVSRQTFFKNHCSQPDCKYRLELLQQQYCIQISAGKGLSKQDGSDGRAAPGYNHQGTCLTQPDLFQFSTVAP